MRTYAAWLFGAAAAAKLMVGLSLIVLRPWLGAVLDPTPGTNAALANLAGGCVLIFGYGYARIARDPCRLAVLHPVGACGKIAACLLVAGRGLRARSAGVCPRCWREICCSRRCFGISFAAPAADLRRKRHFMQLWNTKESYGLVAIVLHWLIGLGVLMMFFIGIQAGLAGEAGNRALRGELMGYHIAWGATLLVLVIARVVSHYAQVAPVKPRQACWLNLLATITQNLLIIAIVIQFLSGPLAVWSGGRAVDVWGVFQIPSPFAARNQGVHEFAEAAHAIGRLIIFVVVPIHVLGALKHLVLDRDGVFSRMLRPGPLTKA